ncbi:MAG TPA: hypothetical protein VNR20_01035 [Terriglobales bacterium]|nr:hypothetical protein [Terriglobales bacterium]
MSQPNAIERHHAELARATAAAMRQHYQEAIEIASELLTSGVYDEIAAADPDAARAARAETRLMMATAMHYNDAHYEDIMRVLKSAMDSPADIRKDVAFTAGIVHASFDHLAEAREAMSKALEAIAELRGKGSEDAELAERERDVTEFLSQLPES